MRWRCFIRWAVFVSSVVSGFLLVPARARATSVGEEASVSAATRTLLSVVIPEPVAAAYPSPRTAEQRVELSDWVDPNGHSTARVGRACEQRYAAYLTGTRELNYLELKLFNDSGTKVIIDARSRIFEQTFRTHGTTRHGFADMPVPVAKHSGKLLLFGLEKRLFYQLRRFDVAFDVAFEDGRTCRMQVEFSRSLPAAPATFKVFSRYDMGVSAGARFASGSLGDTVGHVGSTTALFLDWYPEVQHGVRFEFAVDSLASYDFAGALLFLPSYQYRIFLNPRVSYAFGIGAGAYLFTANVNMPGSVARWALLVRERMQLKFEVPAFTTLSLALCPTLTFGVLPGGPFGPHELSGGLYTGTLELILGM